MKTKKLNPYPPTIEDECSGQEFVNDQHRAWNEGYSARVIEEWTRALNKRTCVPVNKISDD